MFRCRGKMEACYLFLSYFHETGSLAECRAWHFPARLVSSKNQQFCCPTSKNTRVIGAYDHTGLFKWLLRFKSRSLCLHSRSSALLSPIPGLLLVSFIVRAGDPNFSPHIGTGYSCSSSPSASLFSVKGTVCGVKTSALMYFMTRLQLGKLARG